MYPSFGLVANSNYRKQNAYYVANKFLAYSNYYEQRVENKFTRDNIKQNFYVSEKVTTGMF
jgi:hypothetical protein